MIVFNKQIIEQNFPALPLCSKILRSCFSEPLAKSLTFFAPEFNMRRGGAC